MGQFDDKVQRQRTLLKAEEWAKTVKSMHVILSTQCGMIQDHKTLKMEGCLRH